MLILNSEEVKQALSMETSLAAMETAYLEMGQGQAINRPRTDSWVRSVHGNGAYLLKSMDGIIPGIQTGVVRINSNHIVWREYAGGIVKTSPGGRYIGLILLFDLVDGQPLAIFPDERTQAVRVGATTGVAIKYLAPDPVRKAAVIGSGRQAGSALEALFCVRQPEEVLVYSPNSEHRAALAERFAAKGLNVKPSASVETSVKGADIILLATNSLKSVCRPNWVRPDRFISCVKYAEVGDEVTSRTQYVVVNAHQGSPINYLPGVEPFTAHDPLRELGIPSNEAAQRPLEPDWLNYPELAKIIAGEIQKPVSNQSVLFINNIGLGIQFAAVGRAVYSTARELKLGRNVEF